MKTSQLLCLALLATVSFAADVPPATKPTPKITPGQVIVPTEAGAMRRIWGELVSLDLKTRTGTFRKEDTDEVMPFTVMPYSELLHHATFGDLQDFRVGERAIFRLHQNPADAGRWTALTYIQDEMNMMNGHKEYFHVDAADPATGKLTVTQGHANKDYIRETGIVIGTDASTRYWKNAQPATLADIHIGDMLRAKEHGTGHGKARVAWEIFLDDASLLKFQADQKAVHVARMIGEGLPGYVDSADGKTLTLTLFQEAGDFSRKLKAGQKVQVSPAGVDRRPTAKALAATVAEAKMDRNLGKVKLTLEGDAAGFAPAGLARVWVTP
jgi:hypothetical protein